MLCLPGLVKGKPANVVTEVDPDGEAGIGQVVQAAEDGRRPETRIFQLFTDLGMSQWGVGSSKQVQDRDPAGRLPQAGLFQQRSYLCER